MSLRKLSNNKLPRLIMRLRIRSLNKAQKRVIKRLHPSKNIIQKSQFRLLLKRQSLRLSIWKQ